MSELKRLPVKYIRDYIKKDYRKEKKCYICGTQSNLEFHHLYSVSELFHTWCEKNKISTEFTEVEQITNLREKFEEECKWELSNDNAYTLCKEHHSRLHNIYGQRYENLMAKKIKKWIELQREKVING